MRLVRVPVGVARVARILRISPVVAVVAAVPVMPSRAVRVVTVICRVSICSSRNVTSLVADVRPLVSQTARCVAVIANRMRYIVRVAQQRRDLASNLRGARASRVDIVESFFRLPDEALHRALGVARDAPVPETIVERAAEVACSPNEPPQIIPERSQLSAVIAAPVVDAVSGAVDPSGSAVPVLPASVICRGGIGRRENERPEQQRQAAPEPGRSLCGGRPPD